MLKVEATCSFEISVDFQRTTQHYIPEDRNLYSKIIIGEHVSDIFPIKNDQKEGDNNLH
jgi:hypothetical protein